MNSKKSYTQHYPQYLDFDEDEFSDGMPGSTISSVIFLIIGVSLSPLIVLGAFLFLLGKFIRSSLVLFTEGGKTR